MRACGRSGAEASGRGGRGRGAAVWSREGDFQSPGPEGGAQGPPGGGRVAEAEAIEEIAQPLPGEVNGHEAPPAPAARAAQDIEREHPGHQGRPGERARAGSGQGQAGRRREGLGRQSPGQLSGPAGARDHVGAEPGMRGQEAMEAEQVEAGWRNQAAKFLDELPGLEAERGGAIATRMGQLVEELAGGGFGEAVQGQGGPQEIAAQMLELLPGLSGEGHLGVEGEALQAGTPGLVRVKKGGGGAKPADGLAGRGPVAMRSWMAAAV